MNCNNRYSFHLADLRTPQVELSAYVGHCLFVLCRLLGVLLFPHRLQYSQRGTLPARICSLGGICDGGCDDANGKCTTAFPIYIPARLVIPKYVQCSIGCTYWQCHCRSSIEGCNDSQLDVAWRKNGQRRTLHFTHSIWRVVWHGTSAVTT